jgi:hypothetical protein
MSFYPSLPVRWRLTVSRREPPSFGATVHYNWLPVAARKDAGADVSFGDTAPEGLGFDELASRLGALHRPSDRIASCDGFTPLASFDGRSWHGQFNGATPVMHDVCSLLENELKSIFVSMPSADG